MKKLWSMFAILAALFIVSCSDDYDDTAIKNQINDLENRVTSLEQLCQQMNTNISSMQTILNALQERDYITSVTPIKEGDAVIGYTINFAINDPITIYHGKNGAAGKDGYVPVIGVAKFEDDGLYYWTLDGEWLTDAEGNKVRAQGLDGSAGNGGSEGSAGKDGITPLLKIKLNFWYISYDNGATWERLGPATGVDGADGRPGKDGDSFFKSVEVKDGYVVIVLNDEEQTTISIPTKETFEALEKRVAALEKTAEGLQKLVNAINNSLVIKRYKPFEDETGSGYEITFAKADGTEEETIKIYNGVTPIIGVKWVVANEVEGNEAAYYWTVNGELVKDADGKLIPATGPQGPQGEQGSDGKDGKTIIPEFKIVEGNLCVSFGDLDGDGKDDWEPLGPVQGEQGPEGPAGKDGTQITVDEEDDGTITIVIGEGEYEFTIPKYKEMDLSFVLSDDPDDADEEISSIDLVKGTKKTVWYKIKYCEGSHAHNDFQLEVLGDVSVIVTPTTDAEADACGEITFFVPFTTEVGTEKIVLFVTDGKSHTTMKTLTVNVKAPEVTDPYFEFNADGSTAWSGIVIDVDGEGHGTIISWEEFNKKNWPDSKADIEAYAPAGTWRLPSKADWTIVHNKLTDFNATINAENANNYNGAHPDYSPIYAKSGTSATEAAYWTSDKETNINQDDYYIYTGTWNSKISFGVHFAKNDPDGYDFMKARCVRDF